MWEAFSGRVPQPEPGPLQAHHTSSVVDTKDALTVRCQRGRCGPARSRAPVTGRSPLLRRARRDRRRGSGCSTTPSALSAKQRRPAAAFVECEVGGQVLWGRHRHQHGDRIAEGGPVRSQPRKPQLADIQAHPGPPSRPTTRYGTRVLQLYGVPYIG
jgi:hypothetical protein